VLTVAGVVGSAGAWSGARLKAACDYVKPSYARRLLGPDTRLLYGAHLRVACAYVDAKPSPTVGQDPTGPSISLMLLNVGKPPRGDRSVPVQVRTSHLAGFPNGTKWLVQPLPRPGHGVSLWIFIPHHKIVVLVRNTNDNASVAKKVAAHVGKQL
jgi:hypothetical protein